MSEHDETESANENELKRKKEKKQRTISLLFLFFSFSFLFFFAHRRVVCGTSSCCGLSCCSFARSGLRRREDLAVVVLLLGSRSGDDGVVVF